MRGRLTLGVALWTVTLECFVWMGGQRRMHFVFDTALAARRFAKRKGITLEEPT